MFFVYLVRDICKIIGLIVYQVILYFTAIVILPAATISLVSTVFFSLFAAYMHGLTRGFLGGAPPMDSWIFTPVHHLVSDVAAYWSPILLPVTMIGGVIVLWGLLSFANLFIKLIFIPFPTSGPDD